MTSTLPSKYRPVRAAPGVQRIMDARGVSLRQAYSIYREQRLAEAGDVPEGQRVAVLGALIDSGARNAEDLWRHMHANNSTINRHDVVKSLWRLQKAGFVRFREGSRGLYGIGVTDAGIAAYSALPLREVTGEEPPKHIVREAADDLLATSTPEVAPVPEVGPSPKVGPLMRDLLARWEKSAGLYAAAQLLEAAGEDEMALTVLEKVRITPLEQEVIDLLRSIGIAR